MTVGEFTLGADGSLVGPAGYMADRFSAFKAKLEAGDSAVFNHGLANGLGTTESLFLVAIQTDYAAWKGAQSFRR